MDTTSITTTDELVSKRDLNSMERLLQDDLDNELIQEGLKMFNNIKDNNTEIIWYSDTDKNLLSLTEVTKKLVKVIMDNFDSTIKGFQKETGEDLRSVMLTTNIMNRPYTSLESGDVLLIGSNKEYFLADFIMHEIPYKVVKQEVKYRLVNK